MSKFKSLIERLEAKAAAAKRLKDDYSKSLRTREENDFAEIATNDCIRIAKETLYEDLETRIRDEIVNEFKTWPETINREDAIQIVNATFSRWGFV